MNQQPNAVKNALVEIRDTLMSPEMKHRLGAVLGSRIDPEKFAQVAMVAISKNQDLIKADRASLFTSCMECAADGLLPNGKDAALVVFNTKVKEDGREVWKQIVQYLPMVRGIYKVAQRTGAARVLNARVVKAGDVFRYAYGFEPVLEHVPAANPGTMTHVYAVVIKPDGSRDLEVMTKADVEAVRARAKSPDSPAWKYHFEEMAKKTIVHRLAKRLDLTPEMQQIVDRIETDYDFDADELEESPRQVGAEGAPRAENFAGAVQADAATVDDYEFYGPDGTMVSHHTTAVWAERFMEHMKLLGEDAALSDLDALWRANQGTVERLSGEGDRDTVSEVRTYYERWRAGLAKKPANAPRGEKKDAAPQQEPKPSSADPGPSAPTTGPVDDDTFPGDRPSASDAAPEDENEAPWIVTFRERLPKVKTEKALDSFTKATFGAPLAELHKSDRPKWDELMGLVGAQRDRIRASAG